jgi:hypothetical protein
MSETKREYAANYCKPPLHTRFKKGQSGNPRGRPKKNLPALLVAGSTSPYSSRLTESVARSPSARQSSPRWSTNPPAPICARPRC